VVAEGLFAYLGRDLRSALAAGAAREPARSPDGGRWLARWALVAALVGLGLFLFGGYHAGFERINAFAGRLPAWPWEWLTALGDERGAFALTLFFSRRHPRVFWTLVTAALVGLALTHGLKPLVAALRPPAVLDADAFNLIGPRLRGKSFPSGHTTSAAVVCGVWVYYAKGPWLRSALVLAAVAVGLSRVALGVHWPVDVAAGLCAGVLAAWAGTALARRSEWGVFDPGVHLALVTLAAFFTLPLLYWDGGYPGAAGFQQVLGGGALAYALYVYLIRPMLSWRWR
jgi:membrane-associated phospholipid phosphatase